MNERTVPAPKRSERGFLTQLHLHLYKMSLSVAWHERPGRSGQHRPEVSGIEPVLGWLGEECGQFKIIYRLHPIGEIYGKKNRASEFIAKL